MSAAVSPRLLLGLAWRRDRIMIAVWYAVLLLMVFASAASTATLYASDADRVSAADAINSSPGLVALYGPILDVHSLGELAMTKMTVTYAVLVAMMLLFVVRRHTRLEEENGQAELVGGAAMTSVAPLRAALMFGVAVSVVLGLLAAALNTAAGLSVAGSLAFGASWAGVGIVATGITAVACQVSPSARTCATIATTAVLGLFILRAVGDTTAASWLSWLSPFGWNTQLRAYGDTRWWVLGLYLLTAAALGAVALALRQHRDLGAGLVEPRPGSAVGSPRLADAVALSLNVHGPMLLSWTVGVAVMGLVFGAITPSFDNFDSEAMRELLERLGGVGALHDTLIAAVLVVGGVIVTCFAVAVITHGGADEHDGRTEQVLATATSRSRSLLATVLVAIGGATFLLGVLGVTMAVGVGNGSTHSFGTIALSALAQAPAMWAVSALAVLCYAVRSRWAVLGWAIVVACTTLTLAGEMLRLPQWVLDLSPYSHTPLMPQEPFEVGPALLLSLVAAAVLLVAWRRYCTRDIG